MEKPRKLNSRGRREFEYRTEDTPHDSTVLTIKDGVPIQDTAFWLKVAQISTLAARGCGLTDDEVRAFNSSTDAALRMDTLLRRASTRQDSPTTVA